MRKLSQKIRGLLAEKDFNGVYQEVKIFFEKNKEYATSNLKFRQLNDKFLIFSIKNSLPNKNDIPYSEDNQQLIDSIILLIQEIEILQNDLRSNFKLNIGEIIKILPLITGLLIYLGFYNKAYYFKEFDIVIYNFVNTSEIILSFLPIISYILIFVLIQIVIYFIFYISNFIRGKFNNNKVIGNIIGKKKLVEYFDAFIDKSERKPFVVFNIIIHPRFVLLIVLIFISFYLGDDFINAESKRSKIYIYIIFIISIWYSFIIEFIYFIIYRVLELKLVRRVRIILITCALWLLLIIISGNILQAKKIKNGNEIYVSFKYKDSLITTNDSLYFIGETKDYIFLYEFSKDSLLIEQNNILKETRDTAIWIAQIYERKNITYLKYKQIDKNGLRFPGN